MTTHHYNLTIDSLRYIPGDVLVEHLGHALRAFAGEGGKAPHVSLDEYVASGPEKVEYREVRNHPFEGPELFDDNFLNEGGPVKEGAVIPMGIEKEIDLVYDGFVPISLDERGKEALSRAISEDFPHLSALFQYKRGQA